MNTLNKNEEIHALIFFDGVCNFCNSSINFIIRNDKKGYFQFSALQSETAKSYLPNLNQDNIESVILVENGKIYNKSTAALKIARKLDGLWPVLYVFIFLPKFMRDPIYDLIGKNRYKWFGKKNECMIPGPDIKKRFM